MGKGVLDDQLRMDKLLRTDVDYERPPRGGDALFDLAGDLRGCTVLDLGCGLGPYRREIESRGARWVGLDLSGPGPTVVGDGLRLPFRAASFDAVLAAAVLEHIPEPTRFMEELARVLRPGGTLFGYVSFLEPFHGISYFHMSHMGVEYLFLSTGFQPRRIFPAHVGVPFQVETMLFPKRVPALQPLVRVLLRLRVAVFLWMNRMAREVLMAKRRLPREQREKERRQYRLLLGLRFAVGFNFVAERRAAATPADGARELRDTGYLSMVREG